MRTARMGEELENVVFFNVGTFVERRMPVDSIDPVLMACQDRL